MDMLITGVNGYIGSKIARALLEESNKVIGIDLKIESSSFLLNSSNFEFYKAEITDKETFSHSYKETDVLVHCAALVHKRSSDLSKRNYFKINYEGTKNILNFLHKDRLKQIIFLSTVSVYGKRSDDITPDQYTPTAPEDFYGESKLAAENEIKEFSDKYNIPYTIFRLTPVYGDFFLLNINKRIYLPGKMAFYKIGSGNQRMSLVSVKNVVDVIVKSINNSNYFNKTFIVKDNEDYSINEIISVFKSLFLQHNRPVIQVPLCIPETAFKLLSLVIPERARFYQYQLEKIADDDVYSGAKLHSMIQMKWNLKNTFKS